MTDLTTLIEKLPELEAELAAMEERLPGLRAEVRALQAAKAALEIETSRARLGLDPYTSKRCDVGLPRRRYDVPVRVMIVETLKVLGRPVRVEPLEAAIQEKYQTDVHRGTIQATLTHLRAQGVLTNSTDLGWALAA